MVKKKILLLALLITLLIFLTIYFFNMTLSNEREDAIVDRMDTVIANYEEMQTLSMMTDVFGQQGTCLIMQARLLKMNEDIWETGRKIDQYRTLTEEFMNDPFYIEQKTRFNINEVLYFSMVKKMQQSCDVNQSTILFFYQKKEECPNCDAQSFVLTDIRREHEQELSIFSFDADLNLAPITVLMQYYNITEVPCTVVNETSHCGLYNKDDMMKVICETESLSDCNAYAQQIEDQTEEENT